MVFGSGGGDTAQNTQTLDNLQSRHKVEAGLKCFVFTPAPSIYSNSHWNVNTDIDT